MTESEGKRAPIKLINVGAELHVCICEGSIKQLNLISGRGGRLMKETPLIVSAVTSSLYEHPCALGDISTVIM